MIRPYKESRQSHAEREIFTTDQPGRWTADIKGGSQLQGKPLQPVGLIRKMDCVDLTVAGRTFILLLIQISPDSWNFYYPVTETVSPSLMMRRIKDKVSELSPSVGMYIFTNK